jgi:acetoin utilization deacetylase AcuC-like enzyme
MKRFTKIKTFYTPKQVCRKDIEDKSTSKSPLKPLLLMNYLNEKGFSGIIETFSDFSPFRKNDFLMAHTKDYVNDFFEGGPLSEMNGLPWSTELVASVCYTNSSLYHAIRYACIHPETLTFSPTSGFHHAMPDSGSGFCTFSGQVIASLKLYREMGLVGAYLDLDGHFGNSIPNSASIYPEVNEAIKMNINPKFSHQAYLEDLAKELEKLFNLIRKGDVHYVVWCHGADSHEWDDLGYQCSTEEWFSASQMFYNGIKNLEEELGRFIPVTLSLFGGYRRDDYESVLSLHAGDLKLAAYLLLDKELKYEPVVRPKIIRKDFLLLNNESSSSTIKRA